MSENLSNLAIGKKAKIINIDSAGDQRIKRRLRDMGIIKGEIVLLKKKAPLGDPLEIIIKGYSLSLRKQEAKLICIEIINE
ncbi:MAG: Fe2+ transport system protein FeoA [Rickettsiales bacterium]|jgi:Fe2+ transport system protein FeoA